MKEWKFSVLYFGVTKTGWWFELLRLDRPGHQNGLLELGMYAARTEPTKRRFYINFLFGFKLVTRTTYGPGDAITETRFLKWIL